MVSSPITDKDQDWGCLAPNHTISKKNTITVCWIPTHIEVNFQTFPSCSMYQSCANVTFYFFLYYFFWGETSPTSLLSFWNCFWLSSYTYFFRKQLWKSSCQVPILHFGNSSLRKWPWMGVFGFKELWTRTPNNNLPIECQGTQQRTKQTKIPTLTELAFSQCS